jgi:hypothetical protein
MKRKGIIILTILMSLLVGCANNTPSISDDGAPLSVQDYDLTITIVEGEDSLDIDGKYTGKIVDGKPQGEGIFKSEGENGSVYMYEGAFSDGCYNGYGVTTLTNGGETLQMAGTYTQGVFTPTAGESFNYIGQLDLFGKFAVPEAVVEYIDSNISVFPIATKETIQSADIQEFSSKQFIKTRKQEQIGLVKLNLYAVQVFEDDYLNGKLTYLLAADDDNNYYAMYYLGSAEVYDEDTFTAYAIPCTTSSFDNIGGGTTNVIVIAACYIE